MEVEISTRECECQASVSAQLYLVFTRRLDLRVGLLSVATQIFYPSLESSIGLPALNFI